MNNTNVYRVSIETTIVSFSFPFRLCAHVCAWYAYVGFVCVCKVSQLLQFSVSSANVNVCYQAWGEAIRGLLGLFGISAAC